MPAPFKTFALLVGLLLLAEVAQARDIYPGRIPNGTVNSCHTCHIAEAGGGPRNSFGEAFDAGGKAWSADLAVLDSDGDGHSNGAELLDPTGAWSTGDPAPGDPADVTLPGDANSKPADPVDPGECPAVDIGAPCASHEDCGVGGTCFDAWSTGYCTVDALVACCPPGSRAEAYDDGSEWCLKTCAAEDDCRAEEEAYQICNEDIGVCEGCLIPEVTVGGACASDADCGEGGTCWTDEDGFPGGSCVVDWDAYCCPAGSTPVTFDDDASWCVKSCSDPGADAECREAEGYLCDVDSTCWPAEGEGEGDGGGEGGEGGAGDEGGEGGGEGGGEAGGEAGGAAGGEAGGEAGAGAGAGGSRKKDDGCATAPAAPGSWWLLRR